MANISSPVTLLQPSPLDSKLCNWYVSGADIVIETIVQYLSRVTINRRSPNTLVSILIPKEGYTPEPSYPYADFKDILLNFNHKFYYFKDGLYDEDFIEFEIIPGAGETGPTGPTGPTGAASTVAGPTGPTGPAGEGGSGASSYTLDFQASAVVMNDINLEGAITITDIIGLNVDTLKLDNVAQALGSGLSIAVANQQILAWEITRTAPGYAALGIKFTINE